MSDEALVFGSVLGMGSLSQERIEVEEVGFLCRDEVFWPQSRACRSTRRRAGGVPLAPGGLINNALLLEGPC